MTKTDEVLKACPWCGNEAVGVEQATSYWVVCQDHECQAEGPCRDTEAQAIAAWNTRIQPADDVAVRIMGAVALNHALIVVGQPKGWEWGINDITKMLDAMRDYAALASPQGEKGEG